MFRKLKMGMIGGGEGSFIGSIHRMAARLDGLMDCVAGALSSDPEKARRSGLAIGLSPDRSYSSYEELIDAESKREDGVDVIAIVTPNHLHFAPAKLALQKGFDVIVDKPLCFSLEEARQLRDLVKSTGRKLALTHTYAGYAAVIEARALVRAGKLGRLRKVSVEYPQGWLSTKLEDEHQKQASWRTDRSKAGQSCCFADIGTHALHLAEFISGQRITSLLAELQTFVPGRDLDDDATLLLRFNEGLRGSAIVSQMSTGEGNALKISLYGELGGLHWTHREPTKLRLLWPHRPQETLVMGVDNSYLSPETLRNLRVPSGHPEGYIEAFANIYKNFSEAVLARGESIPGKTLNSYPDVEDGFRGMALIEAAVKSSQNGSVWTAVEEN